MKAPLMLGHWNVGGRPTREVIHRIHHLWDFYQLDALTLNEVGDQGKALRILEAGDLKVLNGNARVGGSRKEAICFRPQRLLPKGKLVLHECHPREKGDPRAAGPLRFGPKYVQAQEFDDQDNGRSPWIATMHPVPSIRFHKQFLMAHRHFTEAGAWVESTHGALALGGDMNASPRNSIEDPLRHAGLRCSQIELPEDPTFGKNAIDQWWVRGFKLTAQLAVDERWDHDALIVTAKYIPKKAA